MSLAQTSPLFLITGIKAAKFAHLETPAAALLCSFSEAPVAQKQKSLIPFLSSIVFVTKPILK